MEIIAFVQNFADQFDDTEIYLIHSDTDYKSLEEWSSLVALSVIAMVDDMYGVEIGAKEILKCETVNNLFETVKCLVRK